MKGTQEQILDTAGKLSITTAMLLSINNCLFLMQSEALQEMYPEWYEAFSTLKLQVGLETYNARTMMEDLTSA